ncbi:MAG: hypothetical protein IKP58_06415 [Victivallales bacterium]|nr:hypothetical protein [Victivallales bacterium]
MFKSLQATIFCFAAVILAIVLISSSLTGNKKSEEMTQQIQSLQEQEKLKAEELDKCQKELEASKTEKGLLSAELRQEKEKTDKASKKLLDVATRNETLQRQLEASAKTITELQNQLAVSRQLASNAAKPEELKKLQQEVADLKAEIANMKTEREVLFANARANAKKYLDAVNKLKAVQAKTR